MNNDQRLEKYILEHPDYWEFENEIKEVSRLKELCNNDTIQQNILLSQNTTSLLSPIKI